MAEMKQKHPWKNHTTFEWNRLFFGFGHQENVGSLLFYMSRLGIARVYTLFNSIKERPFRIPGEQNGFSCLLEKALF